MSGIERVTIIIRSMLPHIRANFLINQPDKKEAHNYDND